jgi:hypothetical protein
MSSEPCRVERLIDREPMFRPLQLSQLEIIDRTAPLPSPDDELYPDAVAAFVGSGRHDLAVGTNGRVLVILYEVDVDSLVR